MAIYLRKTKAEILREALRKLEKTTPISATSPGSVARAFTEAITNEISDYYDALDFQVAQSVISSAAGRALDLIGELYSVKRRTISQIIAIDRKVGAFYFYIDSATILDVIIPIGTEIYTASDSFVGRQLRYKTTNATTISVGQTRSFASIVPDFSDAIFTAAPNTLVIHGATSPPGVLIKCTNPKAIPAQEGFESDDNYRVRIIKAIRVAAGGTMDAVRFTALAIPGVRDVRIQEVPYGLGSFRLIVTPEDVTFTSTGGIQLRAALEEVRPVGMRMFVIQPSLLGVDIRATAIVKKTTKTNRETLSRGVNIAAKRYLNSLLAGDVLVYNKLIQYMLDSSSDIIDVQLTRYAPNGVESLRRNYTPKEDEILVPGRIEVGVSIL